MTTKQSVLLPLVDSLKGCPSRDNNFSPELLTESWERLRQQALRRDKPNPPIMAGLILDNPTFAQLLNEAERSQMVALAKLAIERYQQKTNPPNKIGKIIAASVKEKV